MSKESTLETLEDLARVSAKIDLALTLFETGRKHLLELRKEIASIEDQAIRKAAIQKLDERIGLETSDEDPNA